MSSLLQSFQEFDEVMAASIDASIESRLLLQEVESGSIRAWLRSSLESVEDSALAELSWKKAVGPYLVKAKHQLLSYLQANESISTRADIKPLEDNLQSLAEATDVLRIPSYQAPPPAQLVSSLERISSSVAILSDEDDASYIAESEVVEIKRIFRVSQEALDELVTEREVVQTTEMILKVKKPDFLGTSMWDFKFQRRAIQAKILDEDWLHQFRSGDVVLTPGDSLRAYVKSHLRYDDRSELVGERYEILKVLAVYDAPPEQPLLLPPDLAKGA
jgi:hypothetical protein